MKPICLKFTSVHTELVGYTLTHTLNSLVLDKSLILLQCYNASYFLCSLDKGHFTITHISNYNVYESCDPSCQLMKCHTVSRMWHNHLTCDLVILFGGDCRPFAKPEVNFSQRPYILESSTYEPEWTIVCGCVLVSHWNIQNI